MSEAASPAKSPTAKSPTSKRASDEKPKTPKKSKNEDGSSSSSSHDDDGYQFNINKAVDKEHEGKSLKQIIKLPPSALQGLSDRADPMLASFKISTIEELANWKFYRLARAISILAATEEKNKRPDGSRANINSALDKEFEKSSLKEITKAKVSALQGLAEWADKTLAPLQVKTINDLAKWKYAEWASALVELAQYENADFSSA